MFYSKNAMYNLHLLYRQCVYMYKRVSSVYLDGLLLFASMKQFFQFTWKSQQLHKGISVIKALVNNQNILITVDISFCGAINTELRRAVNLRNVLSF